MMRVTAIELVKIFGKGRTYISYAITGFIVLMLYVAMWLEGQKLLDMVLAGLADTFIFEGNLLNGYFISYIVLNLFIVHVPILIALVTGDLIAGESNAGTFRLLITRPVSRTRLITGKFLAGVIYTSSVVLLLALSSLGLGVFLMGTGDLIVMKIPLYIFSENDVLWRFACAYGFTVISMSAVASLSFFLSSFANNSIGPIIGTAGIIIVFTIISSFDFGFFHDLKPFLFTTHMSRWGTFFKDTVDFPSLIRSTLILTGHAIGFFLLTIWRFNKKDILT